MRTLNLPIKNKDEFRSCEADVFMPNFLSERKNFMFLRSVYDLLLYSWLFSYSGTLFNLTTVCISQNIKF
jgi:hypothetical protein